MVEIDIETKEQALLVELQGLKVKLTTLQQQQQEVTQLILEKQGVLKFLHSLNTKPKETSL